MSNIIDYMKFIDDIAIANRLTYNPMMKKIPTIDRIYRDLVTGTIAPGKRINIDAAKNHYQLSLNAVREALRELIATGMVSFQQNKGFRCTALSLENLKDLYDCRKLIETNALNKSIQLADDHYRTTLIAQQFKLHQLSKRITQTPDHDRIIEWLFAYKEFHFSLFAPIEHRALFQLMKQLYIQTERYRFLRITSTNNPKIEIEHKDKQHNQLIECILESDSPKAQRQLTSLLDSTYAILQKTLFKAS